MLATCLFILFFKYSLDVLCTVSIEKCVEDFPSTSPAKTTTQNGIKYLPTV